MNGAQGFGGYRVRSCALRKEDRQRHVSRADSVQLETGNGRNFGLVTRNSRKVAEGERYIGD
jgi:hypothetical protein